MARRKNSAEMLDILRRIQNDTKLRSYRPKSLPPRSSQPSAVAPPPEPVAPSRLPGGRAEPVAGGGLPAFFDDVPRPSGGGGEAPAVTAKTGTLRRGFLSFLGGERQEPPSRLADPGDRPAGYRSAVGPAPAAGDPLGAPSGTARRVLQVDGVAIPPLQPADPASRPEAGGGLAEESGTDARVPAAGSGNGADPPEEIADKSAQMPPPGLFGPKDATWRNDDAGKRGPAPLASAGPALEPRPKPLFARPAREEGFLARAARVLWGEEIHRGFGKRVEVRLVTIGLYTAVAIGAMLLMAYLLNMDSTKKDDRERQLPSDPEPVSAAPAEVPSIEITRPGAGAPPVVRNEEKVAASSAPDAAPAAAEPAIVKGAGAPKGWYVSIQSMTNEEEGTQIIEHLQKMGYSRFWLRPRKREPNFRDLLLGPYPGYNYEKTKKETETFLKAVAKAPLKKPKVSFVGAFPYENR